MNERLSTEIETGNPHDRYAVAIVYEEHGTVRHIPKKISRLCCSFPSRGVVQVRVLGRRKRSDLPQGGLNVPFMLTFIGKQQLVRRLRRALTDTKL